MINYTLIHLKTKFLNFIPEILLKPIYFFASKLFTLSTFMRINAEITYLVFLFYTCSPQIHFRLHILQGVFLNKIMTLHSLMEKAMAPHSSTLAWKIPWTEEPGGLQSMGSLRVGHDWATSLFTFMHWRRKWQPTPVFLPGESQGQGSLVGCRLWGHTELDTTKAT